MAQVSLQINGYGYILGCADGEEEHLRSLAADLDRRIDEIKASTGPTGEARMLLMAALVLSDELHDLRGQRDGAAPASASAAARSEPKIGRRLRGITRKAEAIAASAEALPLTAAPENTPEQTGETMPRTTPEPKPDTPVQQAAGPDAAAPNADHVGDHPSRNMLPRPPIVPR
jgi:cell division protein ZapA